MLVKSTILFALLNSIVGLAAPAETKTLATSLHTPAPESTLGVGNPWPFFKLVFKSSESFLLKPAHNAGDNPTHQVFDDSRPSSVDVRVDYTDGTFEDIKAGPDGVGRLGFQIMIDNKPQFIGCTVEGKLEKIPEHVDLSKNEKWYPEFTISDGEDYLTPCGPNMGVTIKCGDYPGGIQPKCGKK